MIIGIGSDIVEHDVTEKLQWSSDLTLLKRIFSSQELELYRAEPSIKFLSARFAVKEAVLKCLGVGMEEGLALTEIQTLNDKNGKPQVELTGEVKRLADEKNIQTWHVSITHTQTSSLAFIIAEGGKA
jgi:holo-[acyl-carrier protein] synthase